MGDKRLKQTQQTQAAKPSDIIKPMLPSNQNNPSFLVFSDDWGEHPSSCQHIFRHIVKHHKVLWVNTLGMRNMKLTRNDVKKAFLKLRKMFLGAKVREPDPHKDIANLIVIQPFMLPFTGIPGIRRFNAFNVIKKVKKEMLSMGMQQPILVTTVPNACDYVGKCGEKLLVYYCVDDFSLWPGLNSSVVRKMEDDLVRAADLCLATAEKLQQRLITAGKKTYLLSHGVDIGLFRTKHLDEHLVLKNIPKPRVGYYGLFDERSDKRLIKELAKRLPHISFVITGKIETDITELTEEENIYFTGPVPYAELPAMVSGWEACFLAYLRTPLTEAISPLKLKEYLASGKPVITTPLPEVQQISHLLSIGETVNDWVAYIQQIVTNKGLTPKIQRARMEYLTQESWEQKAASFYLLTTERELTVA